MTKLDKETHLRDLFFRAGNARGLGARWISHHLLRLRELVEHGYYEQVRDTLERAIHTPVETGAS